MAQLRQQDPQQNSGQPIIESGAITCSAHVWYGLYRTSWWTCVVTRVCKHCCSLWIWRILSLVQLVKLQGKSWGLITSHFHIGLQSPPRSIFAHHITLRWLCCVCVGPRIQIDCIVAKVAYMHHLLSFARCTMPCVSTSSCSVYVPPLGTHLWFAKGPPSTNRTCAFPLRYLYYFLYDDCSAIIRWCCATEALSLPAWHCFRTCW